MAQRFDATDVHVDARRGLTTLEAERRLQQFGPNLLTPRRKGGTTIRTLLKALTDPMALLLMVAAPTYVVLGDTASAAFTAAAILPVAGIDVFLEQRAEGALEQLRELTAPTARAIRDGEERLVPVETLVPGDAIVLEEGDYVPADGELIDGLYISTNESALTGESATVAKSSSGDGETGLVFAGTYVVAGHGVMHVTSTGLSTRIGQIAHLVAQSSPARTPLQQAVQSLIEKLGALAAVFCIAVVGVQLAYGVSVADALLAGVSLAIVAVPEEYAIVFTLYLALGAWRLSRENSLVRRLVGVETLGSTSVICADKTGTLTMGELAVTEVVPLRETPDAETALFESAVLACETRPFDPLDLALLTFSDSKGVHVRDGATLVQDYPFDPTLKYLSHVWQTRGGYRIGAKGALEGILEASHASADTRSVAQSANRELAQQGYRVIAIAGGALATSSGSREEDEAALEFLGLIGFVDPVREGVAEALDLCKQAGVRVLMITGDHPITATAVGASLGLSDGDSHAVCTGDELDMLTDAELAHRIDETSIFARTRPEQKYRIVQVLRAKGEVVAMTGDGINDAPALRQADVGIAMGRRGTEVAREAATLVLLDDNFATIVTAVREGRRIFDNLRRAFLYLIAFHIPTFVVALAIPLLDRPLLLTPVNLVLLEVILHPIVTFVFVNDPLNPRLMQMPPRPKSEALLRIRDITLPVLTGLSITVGGVGLYLGRLLGGASTEEARATALIMLIVGQVLLVLVLRSPGAAFWRNTAHNVAVPVSVTGALAVLLAVVLVPGLNDMMGLRSPGLFWWAVAVAVAVLATTWMEPLKSLLASRRPGEPARA